MGRRGTGKVIIALATVTLALLLVGGCSCAIRKVVEQAAVTARGLSAAQDISSKANEGYDVREARAKWLQALDAYNRKDYETANRLLDQVYSSLENLEKVAERLDYTSLDGTPVSGLLFKPPGEPPWPLVVVNHAGFGTAGDFSDVALMIRDRGYLVFNPDFRGSGNSQGRHEGAKGEVDDVLAAVRKLKEMGLVDGDRVGMYGQSHGAAVSLIAAGRDPSIKAVVAEAPFTDAADLYRHVKSSKDPAAKTLLDEFVPMVGGTPEQVPEEYRVRSAVNYADGIQAAVFIIHGEKDPLIPVEQARRMYDILRERGKTVEMKIYPNEGHCVNDPAGRAEVWELMFEWFSRYL